MTKKELAERLHGREYRNEITREEAELANMNGIVVVYGASDDLVEFRGAIIDEVDCYNGGTAYLTESGLFKNECDDDNCPYAKAAREKCKTIEAVWCDPGSPFAWTYKTDIPHLTFDIMEDGLPYCRGIVFGADDLKR